MRFLLAHCDWPGHNTPITRSQAAQQGLVMASTSGHVTVAEYLLDFDDGSGEETVGIDAADALHGETALTAACLNGHKRVVELLLGRGASPDQTNNRGLPPFLCAAKVRVSMVEKEMRGGAAASLLIISLKGASIHHHTSLKSTPIKLLSTYRNPLTTSTWNHLKH